jgi:RNA polymerase sigma-70 factor, ECF subfamily
MLEYSRAGCVNWEESEAPRGADSIGADISDDGPPPCGRAGDAAGRAMTVSGVLTRIEACIPALRRYAAALLRNREDADDLVHDCLVRALDKLHTRRDDADVRAWLFAIMHNLFISQLRRAKARPAGESLDETHEAAMSMRGDQESRLNWRDLLRGLNQLPVEQRTVILLVSVEDLSYAEAANVLGIPVGTVMSRLARGRERLRQLTEEGEAKPALRRVK